MFINFKIKMYKNKVIAAGFSEILSVLFTHSLFFRKIFISSKSLYRV